MLTRRSALRPNNFNQLVSCFSYILAHWRNINFDILKEQYVLSSNMSWWQASSSGCADGVLLPHGDVSDSVYNNMEHQNYYWIGALEVYTPWKWTGINIIIVWEKNPLQKAAKIKINKQSTTTKLKGTL